MGCFLNIGQDCLKLEGAGMNCKTNGGRGGGATLEQQGMHQGINPAAGAL